MKVDGRNVVGAYRNRLTCFARLKHSTNSNRAIERGSEWERGRVRQRHGSGCGRNRSLRAVAQKWRPHKSNVNCIEGTCIHAYTHAHTPDTHGSHAHTKGLTLTLNKRKHTHPTVLCGDFLVFIYINWISMCLPHSANRKLQRRRANFPFTPLPPHLFTLCQTHFRPYHAQLAKRKRRQKGNMYVIYRSLCHLSLISFRMFLCFAQSVGLTKGETN